MTDATFYCAYGGPKGARAIRTLTAQLREHPDARWTFADRTRTVRETASDAAATLESCNPAYARRLDRALRAP